MSRVLVIDDDQIVRILLTAMLETGGYAVDIAPDGRQALGIIEKAPPDVVITDLVMPQMEGMEIIMTIQSIAPEIPIVAMTGVSGGNLKYLQAARRLGAAEILAKPVQREELFAALERILPPDDAAPPPYPEPQPQA